MKIMLALAFVAGLFTVPAVKAEVVNPRGAAAAALYINSRSCGGTAAPNAYCSWVGTGSGVVINAGSCNVVGSCLDLGIVTIGSNSCNGSEACYYAGSGNSTSIASIGNNSCNADYACY